ncbi:amidase [filamentous cyanobacterium LEGE 11480]|uniref:Amidase n=1 Tax=Romeriopsis navalis LEGE 11480 TaxID=2777977 RepID=A0A928Z228_9CYAN|nr:amidase [Romeriopsis navalis]MBE9028607.1 amidase [Romeriopsis navalis LEGE 11480]
MPFTNLAFTAATEQARLIRQKQVSPLELTQLYIDRITQLDPDIGSFFYVAAEQAIADAKAKTEQLITQDLETLPPFFGVPTGIKDLSPVAGMPCSYGVKILKKRPSDPDDGLVTRLKQAGFVILGKTATSQLGGLPYTEPPGFAPTRSPWNLTYTAGGSSGGAGAAVAGGLCAVAVGSDAGGSVRIPAACCGLIGLKPSRGRVSNAPAAELFGGFLVHGPMGRSIADVATLLDVMSGYMPGDPYWLSSSELSFAMAAQDECRSLKIGLLREISPTGQADAETIAMLEQTAMKLEGMGHIIEPVDPAGFDGTDLIEPFRIIWQTQMDVGIPGIFLEKMNRQLWLQAQVTKASRFTKAQQQLHYLGRRIVQASQPYDCLLMPTVMSCPPQIGEWKSLNTRKLFQQIINWIAPCPLFNVSGQPAIALPVGMRSNGLPLSLQLVGLPAQEALLLQLSGQMERHGMLVVDQPEAIDNLTVGVKR